MEKYNPKAMYSFLYPRKAHLKKEINMKFIRLRHGKKEVINFYAERTDIPNKFVVPSEVMLNGYGEGIHKDFVGTIKEGILIMGKVRMDIVHVEQLHCGVAIITVEEYIKEEADIEEVNIFDRVSLIDKVEFNK